MTSPYIPRKLTGAEYASLQRTIAAHTNQECCNICLTIHSKLLCPTCLPHGPIIKTGIDWKTR